MDALTNDDDLAQGTDAAAVAGSASSADIHERIRGLETAAAKYQSLIGALQLENRVLLEKLRALKARKFGASSERRVDADQVVMAFLEQLKTAGDAKLAEQLAAEVLAELHDLRSAHAAAQ